MLIWTNKQHESKNAPKALISVAYYRNGEPKILKEIITYDKYDINKRYDLE
jgi:hypothetical protein